MPYKDPADRKAWNANWYRRTHPERLAYKRKYQAEHLESVRAARRKWQKENREKVNANRRELRARKAKAKRVATALLAKAAERAQLVVRGYAGNLKPRGI